MKEERWILLVLLAAIGFLACGPGGSIEVNSTPQGADVYLDDVLQEEQTNCVLTKLEDGEYTVLVDLEGYAGWQENVIILDGGSATVDAILGEAGIVLWTYEAGGWINGVPAIGDDGTVYFTAEDKNLYALDAQGNLMWSYEVEGGLRSSPTMGIYGNIYIGDFNGWVYSIGPDGVLNWKFQPDSFAFQVISSPAIGSNGTVYVILESFDAPSGSRLYAFNIDGTVNWFNDSLPNMTDYDSPTIASDGTVYVPSLGVMAIAPGGSIKWSMDADAGARVMAVSIGSDGTIYAPVLKTSTTGSRLLALNPADGSVSWEYAGLVSDVKTPPAVSATGSIFFITLHGYLYALNSSGELQWRYDKVFGSMRGSTPAIGSDGIIYAGTGTGVLTAFNPDSTIAWEYETGEDFTGSPTMTSTGVIYVGAGRNLYAIATSARGLANSPWPCFRHDTHNTGNVSGP